MWCSQTSASYDNSIHSSHVDIHRHVLEIVVKQLGCEEVKFGKAMTPLENNTTHSIDLAAFGNPQNQLELHIPTQQHLKCDDTAIKPQPTAPNIKLETWQTGHIDCMSGQIIIMTDSNRFTCLVGMIEPSMGNTRWPIDCQNTIYKQCGGNSAIDKDRQLPIYDNIANLHRHRAHMFRMQVCNTTSLMTSKLLWRINTHTNRTWTVQSVNLIKYRIGSGSHVKGTN